MPTSAMTFDQTFLAAVAISSVVMVCSGLWIIHVLIQIEKSKAVALSSVLEDDGTGNGDLQFEESTSDSRGKQLEVETVNGNPSGGDIELSPTGSSRKSEKATSPKTETSSPAKPMTAKRARRKLRRVSWTFINIQIVSVLALILLTYLLMVQSTAAVFLRVLGSLCVFAVFLRFQIGEEIRRQRVDRLMLLLSLFLLIASMLSTLVYSMKQLKQGEIYEGPARIVGYNEEQYNNTKHDPTTRTDISVSWGKDWGCPWSGGKVCQANVQGAMCQTHPDMEQTKHKPNYDTRHNRKRILEDISDGDEKEDEKDEKDEESEEVEEALEEDLEDEEKSNQELEEENENLTAENEMLQKEIDELKEENEVEDEENNELVDQENSELNEMADEYNEDLMIVEEEEYEDAQEYVDSEFETAEDSLEEKIDSATDDATKEELTEELEEDQDYQEEIDEEYEEDEELLDEYADEYAEASEEDYDEFVDEQDNTFDLEDEKDELEEEVEETEDEINEMGYSSSSNGGGDSTTDDQYEAMAEEIYDQEEEEIEEEYEEEYFGEDDDWYWDEYPAYYDDDYYEDEYWNYDWDSVWGDYACEDLFDADIGGQTFDPETPAGGDDEWPFVNIYGSCKTCEAYILDYFAEEAFEETQEYKQQAIVYLAGAVSGFIWAFLSYIKYKVLPTSENEIELLGSDGGVLA